MPIRSAMYRLPLPAYAAFAWLGAAALMAIAFSAMNWAGGETVRLGGSSIAFGSFYSGLAAIMMAYSERKKRREWPSAGDRLAFDAIFDHSESIADGERLPEPWRRELRTIAQSRWMGFLFLMLMVPVAPISVAGRAANGDAVWPTAVLIVVLFALAAIGALYAYRRARKAEHLLNRTGSQIR